MNTSNKAKLPITEKINYGLDAPGLVRFFFAAGIVAAVLAVVAFVFLNGALWALLLKIFLSVAAVYLLGMGLSHVLLELRHKNPSPRRHTRSCIMARR